MKNLLFKFGLFWAILLLDTLNLASTTNYCDPALCTVNNVVIPHIGCNNDGNFFQDCIEPAEIRVTSYLKEVILHIHNDLRNKVANGSLPGFQSAKRMTTMTWDPELAFLAELNVRSCVMEHDECHNTVAYKYSGQNIGIQYQTKSLQSTEYKSLINLLINKWFNEYKYANQGDVDNCVRTFRPNDIGQFTAMIHEKSAKVGCGIVRFVKYILNKKWDSILLTCNYSFGNVVNYPIYVKGPMCSGCQKGCNPEFSGLCSVAENVSPVPGPILSVPVARHSSGQYAQPVLPVPSPRQLPSGQSHRTHSMNLGIPPISPVPARRHYSVVQPSRPVSSNEGTPRFPPVPAPRILPPVSSPRVFPPGPPQRSHSLNLGIPAIPSVTDPRHHSMVQTLPSKSSRQPIAERPINLQLAQPVQPDQAVSTSRFMVLIQMIVSLFQSLFKLIIPGWNRNT